MTPYIHLMRDLRRAEASLFQADRQMPPERRIESVAAPLHTAMLYVQTALGALRDWHDKKYPQRKCGRVVQPERHRHD